MSRVILCDRCGAKITGPKIGFIAWNWKIKPQEAMPARNPYEDRDFCEKCMDEILTCIERSEPDPEPAADPVPVPVLETEKNPDRGGAKKPVDRGKVLALYKAGWSYTKIADEMGCSPARIGQIIKEEKS